MHPWQTRLVHQLQELHLVRCSLLPGEHFSFVLPEEDNAVWSSLLDAFADAGGVTLADGSDQLEDEGGPPIVASLADPPCQARFELRVDGAQTWFEVALPRCTDAPPDASATTTTPSIAISVQGDRLSREAHARWTAQIGARIAEIEQGFPAYEVLAQLTAALHDSVAQASGSELGDAVASSPGPAAPPPTPHHALLTSHHLISPTKRRTLHHLATQLGLAGFAKVGYPGIIYAEGPQEGIEAFVREVKGMQWLALRVRFVEAAPVPGEGGEGLPQSASWVEVSKVGEVLELMRVRGREGLVTALGIGAPSKEIKR